MWVDESDTTQLAQRLRLGPRELLEAVGGPWYVSERLAEHEAQAPGTLFVGRAGPSVGVLVGDEPHPAIRVGVAIGLRPRGDALVWTVVAPIVDLRTPPAHAPDVDRDDLLDRLAAAVDAAAAAKRPHLVVCRYCGRLVAGEFAVGDELCAGCGARVFGSVG